MRRATTGAVAAELALAAEIAMGCGGGAWARPAAPPTALSPRPPMAEPDAEEPDERLLLLAEPAPQGGPPWGGPQGVKAAPGGAVRLCGELGLQEEEGEEDSGPEGDGEDEPLLRASGTGRGRRAGVAWDKEPRAAAGTARGRRRLPRRARLNAEGSCRGCASAARGRVALPGEGCLLRLPGCLRGRGSLCPVLPAS